MKSLSGHPHILPSLIIQSYGRARLPYVSTPYPLSIHLYGWALYVRLWLSQITRKQWLVFTAITIGLPTVALFVLFLLPRTVQYNFALSQNCFLSPTVLPNSLSSAGDGYRISHNPKLKLGNTTLLSTTSCVTATQIPSADSTKTLQLLAPLGFKKSVHIATASLPQLSALQAVDQPVASKDDLLFALTGTDATFEYMLELAGQQSECSATGAQLQCPLSSLVLDQGQSYNFVVQRKLQDQTEQVFSGSVRLLDPLELVSESITPDQIVYEKVTTLNIKANKSLADVGTVVLSQKGVAEPIPAKVQLNDTNIIITPATELAREAEFLLTIKDSTAKDSAYLAKDFSLSFKTSGGPKVQGTSVGSYKVSTTSSMTITFDTELDPNQNFANFVVLATSSPVATSVTSSGAVLTINPTSTLPACTTITITVKDGISNKFGVSGASSWSTQSRTICQVVSSIGTSVQGRSITSYRFGSGPNKVLFVGGMHGNERSSVSTMISWVDELERNYAQIPADKTIIVIPNHNPDAYAVNSRTNANKVDLNRNFPANDWASGVYVPRSTYLEMGGGATPLSEPESQALATFITSNQPKLVLTFHATARAVISNGSGNSAELANLYAQKSGFTSYDSGHEDEIFAYPTTGEFETWLHDKQGIATLLVELATMSGNEINTQKPAMWAVIK